MPASRGLGRVFALVIAALAGSLAGAAAQSGDPPQLHTHQSYMEEVMRVTTLDVKDPLAVFAFVLNSLPDTVNVYPTENYYYFTFTHNGVAYAGNIRLDASDRDQGKVQFGYYEQTTGWRDETPIWFRVLDASSGVKLEKLERFRYRLSYKDKSVVFALERSVAGEAARECAGAEGGIYRTDIRQFRNSLLSRLQCGDQ